MMRLSGTQTEKNLAEAFAMEAQSSMKYHYYSTTARREKMVQMSELFADCSKYELEHAKMWYKLLLGASTTGDNLKQAVKDEHEEQYEKYATFAEEARAEGFDEIANLFESVAKIAGVNEKRFSKLLSNLENGTVFSRKNVCDWMCSTCGNVLHAANAPDVCPVCDHGQAYYRIVPENY